MKEEQGLSATKNLKPKPMMPKEQLTAEYSPKTYGQMKKGHSG